MLVTMRVRNKLKAPFIQINLFNFILGVVPAQQSSPQFIIAPHPMAVAGNQAAGGPGATANAAANQMQPPPQ